MSRTTQRYEQESGILFDRVPGDKPPSAQGKRRRWRRGPNVKGPTRFFQQPTEREPRTEAEAIALAKQARSLG